jgi:hypothetical protein
MKIQRLYSQLFLISLFLAVVYHPMFAQAHPALRFYPLSVGDVWQYHSKYSYWGNVQHSFYTVEVTGDTLPANGKKYSIIRSSNNSRMIPRYQRVDSLTAQVLMYDTSNGGAERLMDSLTAPVMTWFTSYRARYTVGISMNKIDSLTLFGEKRMRRWYTSLMGISPGYSYKLTEQLGITEFFNAIALDDQIIIEHTSDTLTYAKINGIQYGTLVSVPHGNETRIPQFGLFQNYPNPFNPATHIEYEVPHRSQVTLIIYDMLGREVTILVNKQKEAGQYSATWNASVFAAGVYFARMQAGNYAATRKLVLLK